MIIYDKASAQFYDYIMYIVWFLIIYMITYLSTIQTNTYPLRSSDNLKLLLLDSKEEKGDES